MRPLLLCLLLGATPAFAPALARAEARLVPGAICLPAGPEASRAALRRAQHGEGPARLRHALLTCVRDRDGRPKRPLRLT